MKTEAWVLHKGKRGEPTEMSLESFSFDDPKNDEVLVEPLYGCWEGNMGHALQRLPVDVCELRNESTVVMGNAGVVRVLRSARDDGHLNEGDICLVFCNGEWDEYGYPEKILAYDAPGTIGVLAKQSKMRERCLIPIPKNTQYHLSSWAAFSLRYITAWSNWWQAFRVWSVQMGEQNAKVPFVFCWGGGVSFAQASLAKHFGCDVAMMASSDKRLDLLDSQGILPVDRRNFKNLSFDEVRYIEDEDYRNLYKEEEKQFLSEVKGLNEGAGVDILCEHLGAPIYKASLALLARQGVFTTSGWKNGMKTVNYRAIECIKRHVHVHTHYARYDEGVAAVKFAEKTGWMPDRSTNVFGWKDIPSLSKSYLENNLSTYYPIFEVNKV